MTIEHRPNLCYSGDFNIDCEVYRRDEADALFESLEARIKGLESELHDVASEADPAGTLAELRLMQDAYKAQEKIIEELRELCACAYQFAGSHDAPVPWLDALSAASEGKPFRTENLLPYVKGEGR